MTSIPMGLRDRDTPYSEGENESFTGIKREQRSRGIIGRLCLPGCCRFPLSAEWDRNVLARQASHPVAGCHGLRAVEGVTPGPTPYPLS